MVIPHNRAHGRMWQEDKKEDKERNTKKEKEKDEKDKKENRKKEEYEVMREKVRGTIV